MSIPSPHLLIRPLSETDISAFHTLQSNPLVTKFTRQGPSPSLPASQSLLDDLLVLINSTSQDASPTMILTITVPPSDELIGLIGTFRPREIGFSLHPDFWGKGYASEACVAFCKWYVERYSGLMLFAKVNVENEASVKCLAKSGFAKASEEEEASDEAFGRDGLRETWVFRGSSKLDAQG